MRLFAFLVLCFVVGEAAGNTRAGALRCSFPDLVHGLVWRTIVVLLVWNDVCGVWLCLALLFPGYLLL